MTQLTTAWLRFLEMPFQEQNHSVRHAVGTSARIRHACNVYSGYIA